MSPVTRMNNLLQASYTSYRNGELTWTDWRESLTKNYQDEEFKDLADLLGNAAQIASKVRHAARLRTLGGMLRKLGKLLQRKKLSQKTKGGVDSKHSVTAEKPEGQRLSSDPDGKKKPVRTAAQDREEVSRLSQESAEAKKAGNTALAEAKLAEARDIVRPYIPKTPDDDWSDFLERLDVQAPKDGAVFWSGGKKGQAAAQRYAESIGGTTLEATPGGNVINEWNDVNKLPWDAKSGDPPFSGDLWNGVSEKFAKGAEGKVSVVQTPDKLWDQGTVWHNAEKNIIKRKLATGSVTDVEIFTTKTDGSFVKLSDNYVEDLLNLKGIRR